MSHTNHKMVFSILVLITYLLAAISSINADPVNCIQNGGRDTVYFSVTYFDHVSRPSESSCSDYWEFNMCEFSPYDGSCIKKELGNDGLPIFNDEREALYPQYKSFPETGCPNCCFYNKHMDEWFQSNNPSEYANPSLQQNMEVTYVLPFLSMNGGMYVYQDTGFFPLDNKGLDSDELNTSHNFGFTMHFNNSFYYADTLDAAEFEFTGDDELWVFMNGELVLDISGPDSPVTQAVTFSEVKSILENAGKPLSTGDVVTMDVFFTERRHNGSHIKITTRLMRMCSVLPLPPPTVNPAVSNLEADTTIHLYHVLPKVKIWYDTNGHGFKEYSGEGILVKEGTVLSFFAEKEGWGNSDTTVKTYTQTANIMPERIGPMGEPEIRVSVRPGSIEISLIKYIERGAKSLHLLDLQGNLVTSLPDLGPEPIIWKTQSLPRGIYFLRVFTGSESLVKTFVHY